MGDKIESVNLRAVEAKSSKHPNYRGSVTIDGRKYWLSGWKRQGEE